jgi:hypothetical protein
MSAAVVHFLVMAAGNPGVIIVEHHVYEAFIADLLAATGPTAKIPLVAEIKCDGTIVLSHAGRFRPTDFNLHIPRNHMVPRRTTNHESKPKSRRSLALRCRYPKPHRNAGKSKKARTSSHMHFRLPISYYRSGGS